MFNVLVLMVDHTFNVQEMQLSGRSYCCSLEIQLFAFSNMDRLSLFQCFLHLWDKQNL
jgi:hypothetical protein